MRLAGPFTPRQKAQLAKALGHAIDAGHVDAYELGVVDLTKAA